jgi:thiol-disulfide isomerase/thioredoxin
MKIIKTLVILFLVIGVAAAGFIWAKGNLLKETSQVKGSSSTPSVSPTAKPTPNFPKTIGDFLVTDREIEKENGKPVVYFFGSSSCPHCVWEKPIVKKVFDQFKDQIVYHENFDSEADAEVFNRYADINPGYVPFLILGGKYARMGAGENLGADEEESKKLEEQALTAILCKLTEGKPTTVCAKVQESTAQIP